MKYNITRDFDLYSLLLDRREFNEKEFIKCGVKVEFYEFTDGWNKNCTEFEEYVETEIHIKFGSKSNEFFYCFSYDTKNLSIQRPLSKSSPFLKISIPINSSTYKILMRLELIGPFRMDNKVNIEIGDRFNTVLTSVWKSSATYLPNPYKSQCSYYDTNENPFNSVSYEDCLHKCFINNCYIKYKCFKRDYEYVIRRLDESSFDSKVECNEREHKNCFNVSEKCRKICPIACFRENLFSESYVKFHENKNLKVNYYFWVSRTLFTSLEETADIQLLDYLTYIGGLFGLWFGICLESLLNLIVKHTRNLRTKVKLQVEKLLSLIYIFSICILHCINDLIRNFINYMIERVLSIHNRISEFRFKLKLYAKTFFSFTLTLIQLFIVLFLSFIFCSKSMFETQVKKLLLLIYAFFNYILKCIHDMIVMCINYVQSKNYCTHNRVESINL
jgi:hypothetical protein